MTIKWPARDICVTSLGAQAPSALHKHLLPCFTNNNACKNPNHTSSGENPRVLAIDVIHDSSKQIIQQLLTTLITFCSLKLDNFQPLRSNNYCYKSMFFDFKRLQNRVSEWVSKHRPPPAGWYNILSHWSTVDITCQVVSAALREHVSINSIDITWKYRVL